jgi:predicted ABC-type ATPase
MRAKPPTIYFIAGCNGAGETTFAREFLPKEVKCLRFLNADEMARGFSPLKPSGGAVQAARLLLKQVDECLRQPETFADIRRRFKRSLIHLLNDYLPLATRWTVLDNRDLPPKPLANSAMHDIEYLSDRLKP